MPAPVINIDTIYFNNFTVTAFCRIGGVCTIGKTGTLINEITLKGKTMAVKYVKKS